ncbi:hypothetical protein PPL_10514 [Heterostelium album PN500]|uniref:MHD2 domain-containing protein n=1 Tax=Heterostelium pallidum (strain ATCC 26659 / Pp 5 / PN500) TaxID=670386 RepID=D3BRA8_HETP5|nr:hypothetical protein PPL_10514 [Heterostelium album PN500]EFA75940.1 hypothetical protein PPL_10514 [Heterostelium album PN500]|eukprot:XP_020428074.1 hypothetical protein PPL_10514 [Heterostelium album PN500]
MSTTSINFNVKISGILIELHSKEYKNLLFQCDIGGLKKFTCSKDVHSCSSFDFEDEFEMSCILAIDQLQSLKFKWTVSESGKLFDNIVGQGSVDFVTVATGPIMQCSSLIHSNSGTVVGNITFWTFMTQLSDIVVLLHDVSSVDMPVESIDANCGYRIDIFVGNEDEASQVGHSKETRGKLKWKKSEAVYMRGVPPHQLADSNLFVKIRSIHRKGREITIADSKLPLISVLSTISWKKQHLRESTASVTQTLTIDMKKSGVNIGKMKMTLSIDGVPMLCQQIKTLNKDRNNLNPYQTDAIANNNHRSSFAAGGRNTPWGINRISKQMSEANLLALVKERKDIDPLFTPASKSTLEKALVLPPAPPTNLAIHYDRQKSPRDTSTGYDPNLELPVVRKIQLNHIKSYAVIRAILCLYSNNVAKPHDVTIDEKRVGPMVRDAFGLTQEQYDEVSSKIMEYSPVDVTAAELQLRYAWRDNHPLYRSEQFRDPDGHEKWKHDEIQQISKLLADSQVKVSKPSVRDIFGSTLKRHTLNAQDSDNNNDNDGGGIHRGYKELVRHFVDSTQGELPESNNNRFLPLKPDIIPQKSHDNNFTLKPEFSWILKEYCHIYGIRDFYRNLVVFSILSERFDDSVVQLNAIYGCFGKLIEIQKNHPKSLTIKEEAKFHKICNNLLEQLQHRLSHYRLCFKPEENVRLHKQSGTAALSMVLRLMDKIIRSMDWKNMVLSKMVKSSLIEATEKEYRIHRSRYEYLLAEGSSNDNNNNNDCVEIFALSLAIADICKWLDDDFNLYNQVTNSYLDKELHIQIVIETFVKFINSDLSLIAQKFMHIDVRNNQKLETPAWLTGILVELVPKMIEFNQKTTSFIKKIMLPLDQNLSFFSGNFVLSSVNLLERFIESIIKKQDWAPNGKDISHTSAPIDLFTYIWQCYKSIKFVEDKLSFQVPVLLKSFGVQLDNTFYLYIKGLRLNMLSELDKNHQMFVTTTIDNALSSKKKASTLLTLLLDNKPIIPMSTIFITEKMCLQINDIDEARGLLDEFDLDNDGIFGDSFRDLFKYLKFHWKSLIAYFCYLMDYKIKPMVCNILYGKEIISKDLESFIAFLDSHIKVCYVILYPRLFKKFLKYLFKMIIINIINVLLPKTYNKKIWTLKILSNIEVLIDNIIYIFHVSSNEGLTFAYIKKELRRVHSIIELFSFSVDQLKQYYRMLVESQKLMNIKQTTNSSDCLKVMEYFKDDKDMDQFLKKIAKVK